MVTIMQLTDNLRSYISLQLESMAKTNPMIGFMKPLITRALDKNFSKVSKALDLIADKDGNIDIENILTEMMENLMTTNPFTFKTSFIGDMENINEIRVRLHLTLSFYLYCNYFTYMNKVIYLSCCRHTKLYLPLCCLKNKKVEEYGRRTKFR